MYTYTRKREQGTIETIAGNPQDRINAIKSVVDNKSYAKIDGTMIDLTTAHVIMTVYNAINDTNKAKFANMPAGKMGTIAYGLIK
jgi:hypothetical protein